jgi:hypothetical protein
VVDILAQVGIAVLNGLLVVLYWAWENILALLQVPVALLVMRLVELPQARVEGFAVGRPRERRALLSRAGRVFATLICTLPTALCFPRTMAFVLLLMWLVGGTTAALLRICRADVVSETRRSLVQEVGALWGLKVVQWCLNLATIGDWAVATGLSKEGAASVLAKNVSYVNLILMLRASSMFRWSELQEILRDMVGRGEEGVY